MDPTESLQTLALALLLGMLVGLQRELKDKHIAGFRTFGLVTVFGALTGLIARHTSAWIIAAGLLGVIAVIVVGNAIKLRTERVEYGMTTEVSLLLMFAIGAWLPFGSWAAAAAAAGGTALILYSKPRFKGIIARLDEDDIKAIMQFVLISLIILPILPNQSYGPFEFFNPRLTWLLVVLITGISLGGYLLYKFVGQRAGVLLGGLLGGLVSSTATTVSYARLSSGSAGTARNAAVVILIASAMVYVRMLIEIGVMAPGALYRMGVPIVILGLFTLVVAGLVYRRITDPTAEMPRQRNPSELGAALAFAAFYVTILLLMSAATEWLPEDALFAVALLSGLTDMDAVTLSTSQLVDDGTLDADRGWRVIMTAFISNTVFKFGIACALGHPDLRRHLVAAFGAIVLFALALILFLQLPGR